MKMIPLFPGGKFAKVDDEDFAYLKHTKWREHSKGYACGYVDGKIVYMHRFIMKTKAGYSTDHINRDKLDNRKANLRICSDAENKANSKIRSNNKSGYKGVHIEKRTNRWCAQIGKNNKITHLGTFDSPEEAAMAYDIAAKRIHGEFANLNFK